VHLDQNLGIAAAEGADVLEIRMRLEGSAIFQHDGGQVLVSWHWEFFYEAQELSVDADIAMLHGCKGDGVEPDAKALRLAAKLAVNEST
jgi:hypothetical protein